jgi:dihydroorotase
MSLAHNGETSLVTLITKLTYEPAKIIGNKHGILGTLAVGAPAEVTIFDPNLEWVVDTKAFASKGKNTPLAGDTLKGRVMATIFQGKLVYKDDSVSVRES